MNYYRIRAKLFNAVCTIYNIIIFNKKIFIYFYLLYFIYKNKFESKSLHLE